MVGGSVPVETRAAQGPGRVALGNRGLVTVGGNLMKSVSLWSYLMMWSGVTLRVGRICDATWCRFGCPP